MATLPYHVDCLDICDQKIVVGLSALEGNVWDGAIGVLGYEDGAVLAYAGQPSGIAAIKVIGSDRALIGAGFDDGMLRYFTLEGLHSRSVVQAHQDIISGLSVMQALDRLVSCSWDQDIKIWDISDPSTAVYTLRNAHYGAVNGCSSSIHDAHVLASVGADAMLKIWDTRMNQSAGCSALYAHDCSVACVEWDQSNQHCLYTGSDAGDLYSFDTRKLNDCSKLSIHSSRIRAIKSSSVYPEVICTCSDDTSIALIDLVGGQILNRVNVHQDYVTDIAIVAQEADGAGDQQLTVCSGSTDKSVKLTDFCIPASN